MTAVKKIRTQRDLHIQRKLFHTTTVLAIFSCMVLFSPEVNWLLYAVVGLPLVALDALRRISEDLNRFLIHWFSCILRKTEIRQLTGGSYAIIGIGISYFIFELPVSQLAVLFLAVGDPTASLFGLLYGEKKILCQKSWVGSLAALFFCFLSAFLFLNFGYPNLDSPLLYSLIFGLTGAIAELIPVGRLNDNLTQPLISGLLMSLVVFLNQGDFPW